MSEYFFTVFTPTYNRAYKLKDLYESLKMQQFRDFEWLVVDDGSTDNTVQLLEEFIADGVLNIRFLSKKNEGKHVAINEGAKTAKGRWFFIVDSDDTLTNDALLTSANYCEQVDKIEDFAGVVGLRGDSQGKTWNTGNITNGNTAPKDQKVVKEYVDATAVEYRYKMKIEGDRAEIVKTEILKKYQFPSFEGEKFMPERYLWYSLSKDGYRFRWFNSVIYITEYLEDGLTRNGREAAKKSAKSRSCADNLSSGVKEIPFKDRLILCINYYRYGMYGKKSLRELISNSEAKILSVLAVPIALVYRVK